MQSDDAIGFILLCLKQNNIFDIQSSYLVKMLLLVRK